MTTTQRIKKSIVLLSLGVGAGLFTLSACKNGMSNFETTPSGLEYKIIDDHSGEVAKPGDYLKVSIRTEVHDSTLMDTYKEGPGYRWLPLQKSNGQKYDMMEGLSLLSKGDSAEFVIPADSVMGPMNRPPFVEKGDKIHIFVKVHDIQSKEGYEDAVAKEEKEQNAKDAQIIKHYIDSTGQKATATDDGVYVIVHKEGSGPTPKEGQTVSIMYTGKTLDGQVFDSNQDTAFHHTDPLIFPLGQHRMIEGMESGIKLLKKGEEATLVIPSALAYGPNGRPPVIHPNAVLLFDVKVNDITGKPNPATPQGN